MALEDLAQRIYNTFRQNATNYIRMGREVPKELQVGIEDIRKHLEVCSQAEATYAVHIDPERFWGRTPEEIHAYAQRRAAKNKRRRGYRTLVHKYGEDVAKRIISGPRE